MFCMPKHSTQGAGCYQLERQARNLPPSLHRDVTKELYMDHLDQTLCGKVGDSKYTVPFMQVNDSEHVLRLVAKLG